MRKYRSSADSPLRVDYGVELCEGLRLFPETTALADDFEVQNDELQAAYDTRRAARKALVKARAQLRFANYLTDQEIRSASKAAEIADGGKRGTVFKVAFPKGVGPVVAPPGARQIKPTEELIDRLKKSKVKGVSAFAAVWVPKLEARLSDLQAKADQIKKAQAKYDDAFSTEGALRQEHYLGVDRLMGETRAAFPGDAAKQNLIFPEVEDGDSAAPEESGGGGEPPAPATPPS